MKRYYKCEICEKSIKRNQENPTNLKCRKCIKELKKIRCKKCGIFFHPIKSIRKFCSQKCSNKYNTKNYLIGRKLTKKHRENLSSAAKPKGGKCKFYKINNPYMNKEISVQGTWELKYAHYLNDNKIKWIRSKKINLKYKLNGFKKTYYPDFYLIDSNEYIEVKGYFYEKDKIKMNKVFEDNQDKKIVMLFREDLLKLNIAL
jgi:hypothetical protein